jgi:hypothetical protein
MLRVDRANRRTSKAFSSRCTDALANPARCLAAARLQKSCRRLPYDKDLNVIESDDFHGESESVYVIWGFIFTSQENTMNPPIHA